MYKSGIEKIHITTIESHPTPVKQDKKNIEHNIK
jgi:hypothetical protein